MFCHEYKSIFIGSWVAQSQAGVFSGDTQMRWELEEDENGLISGFNLWFSANPASEGRPSVGAMCMVGARNGENVVITEAQIRDRLVPTFEFECKHRRGNRTRCVGNGLASQPPVALTGRMKRLENPDEGVGDLPVALIEAVRTFCSVGGQRPEDPLLLGASVVCPASYVTVDIRTFIPGVGIVSACCPAPLVYDPSIDLVANGCYTTWLCGDGILDAAFGEECDDGNNVDGDGCSASCRHE